MNRTVLFDRVRAKPFGGSLTQTQVNGINAILDAAGTYGVKDVRHLSYALATAYWETARTMQPIAEYGRGKGRKYGVKGKYGQVPYGRGYVQLTWDENYERADRELGLNGALLKNFDLALKPNIAAAIMFRGMAEGWFTSKRLSNYFSGTKDDPTNARRIINGTDKASTIAGYHRDFLAALKAAGWTPGVAKPTETGIPATEPATGPAAPKSSFWADLIAGLIAIFRRDAK
ncbi:hypothetical protein [Ancylobacter moscoviensis]|uniref:hypothetical protein n=1 Tax=Ancylobacter moscoviensis TaxID=2597768 RepID=UPI001642F5D6|nr:hypothetical protein [Ancylobacter moscoviensis]